LNGSTVYHFLIKTHVKERKKFCGTLLIADPDYDLFCEHPEIKRLYLDDNIFLTFALKETCRITPHKNWVACKLLMDSIAEGRYEAITSQETINVFKRKFPEYVETKKNLSMDSKKALARDIIRNIEEIRNLRVVENRNQRRFYNLSKGDSLHLNTALFYECDAIVTYDGHFLRQSLMKAYPPEAFVKCPSFNPKVCQKECSYARKLYIPELYALTPSTLGSKSAKKISSRVS
jgi:predicted nucleic acid-binding protein